MDISNTVGFTVISSCVLSSMHALRQVFLATKSANMEGKLLVLLKDGAESIRTIMSQWQHSWLTRYQPLDSTRRMSRDESARAVFGHLAKRVDGWSVRKNVFDINCRLYDTVAEVLSSEESSNRMNPPKFDVLIMSLSN